MRCAKLFTVLMIVLGSITSAPVMAEEELVYVPVDPCRIVDTRMGGGAITTNAFRNFRVAGSKGELSVQGGQTDCLDPRAGTEQKPLAISAYVVAVPGNGSGNGVLTAYPSHLLPPPVGAGSTVNFAAGKIIGNTTNITLCDQVTCPTDGEFAILARNTNQHVVIDVQGYFYPSSAGKEVVAVAANASELGLVFGGDTFSISVLTTQGYIAEVIASNGRLANAGTITFTDTNCGNSGGEAYVEVFGRSLVQGSVIASHDDSFQSEPPLLFYVPKPPTVVSNVNVQSELISGGCLQQSRVLPTAQEVLPNDAAITGFPDTPSPAPISIQYQ